MYWKGRQEIIFRHTGEHPFEISGPDALKLLQKNISKRHFKNFKREDVHINLLVITMGE
jgi:hypothetical protein